MDTGHYTAVQNHSMYTKSEPSCKRWTLDDFHVSAVFINSLIKKKQTKNAPLWWGSKAVQEEGVCGKFSYFPPQFCYDPKTVLEKNKNKKTLKKKTTLGNLNLIRHQ